MFFDVVPPPEAIAGRVGSWIDRLPGTHVNASWMVWERALCLADAGRGDEAIAETRRSQDLLDRALPDIPEDERTWNRVRSMSETLVRTGRGEEAVPLWGEGDLEAKGELYRTRAWHTAGEAVSETRMGIVRASRGHDWYWDVKIDRLEREQARLGKVAARRAAT